MPAKRTRHSKPKTPRNTQPVTSAILESESLKLGTGLDNEGFVVDLFLDQEKQVHLTQILHVKSNDGEDWEGWNEKRLIDFLIDRAQLSVPASVAQKTKEIEIAFIPDKLGDVIDIGSDNMALPAIEMTTTSSSPSTKLEIKQPEPATLNLADVIESKAVLAAARSNQEITTSIEHPVEVISCGTHQIGRLLKRTEPFDVRIFLDDTSRRLEKDATFSYTVSISAQNRGQNSKYFIASDQGIIKSTDKVIQVNVPRQNLIPGAYCLRAEIAISTLAQPEEGIQPILLSSLNLKSGLLQVI